MNVLLYRDLPDADVAALSAEFPQCHFQKATSPAQLDGAEDWPEVVFGNAPASWLVKCPRLRWLQIVSSGFDEYQALGGTRVAVTTARGVRAPIIAQHVLMTVLMFARRQPHFWKCQREKIWDRRPEVPQKLEGQTIGLVGYGEVGKEVARLARPLGVRLIAIRRTPGSTPPELDELLPRERMDDLLRTSDHLVLTLPLTAETRGSINRRRVGLLKNGAVVHNIARGELVDEEALIERLREGSLGGAALDVFAREPLPGDSPLWDLPNVVVTPHLAGHHAEAGGLVFGQFRSNLHRWLTNEPLEHAANFARGY